MALGGSTYEVGDDVVTMFPSGVKDISVGMFPSGADTMKVEATLQDPLDDDSIWFEIISETNDATVVSLSGPVAGIRASRESGSADDNILAVQIPGS